MKQEEGATETKVHSMAHHNPVKTTIIILTLCMAAWWFPEKAFAQPVPGLSTSKELPVSDQKEQAPDDALGRTTPRGTLVGFMKEMGQGDVGRAIKYLDTRQPAKKAEELAQELQVVLNVGLSGYLAKVSGKPEGDLEDDLKPDRERIGIVKTPYGAYDIFLERVQRGTDPPVWLFSSDTLKVVPEIYRDLRHHRTERFIPKVLRDHRFFNYPAWQWVGLILVIPLSFLLAWLVTWVLLVSIRFMFRQFTVTEKEHVINGLRGPIRVLALSLGFFIAGLLSYSLLARLFWTRVAETLSIVGITWLCLRLIDPVMERLWDNRRLAASSGKIAVARLLHKTVKVLVILLGAISIFYMAGIHLTAVLTGLGIGGIAVAFAAQKTLENLFGGIMIISDQPIRVGDFCRTGDYQGTVEDIGLRSTRLRTLGRTIVSIPNGQLATMSLENFTLRDKILFRHTIQLRYETSVDQLRFVIAGLRKMLYEHSKVETAGARVRFTGFKDSGLELELQAYILESDYATFLAVQEDLLLRCMTLVEESGTSFAFPSQTTYIAHDTGLNEVKSREAEERVALWRKEGALPFPDFAPEAIAEWENTLEYPEENSAPRHKEP